MAKENNKSFSDIARLDHKLIDEAWSTFKDKAGSILVVKTIATHSGKPINNRLYRGPMMKDGCASWCVKNGAEYDKPFLKNHDSDLDSIGRVIEAEYKALAKGSKFLKDYLYPTDTGSGFTQLTSEIIDEDAIQKILDGRYQTVSVGGSTDAAYCSICTKDHGEFVNMWGSYKKKNKDEEGGEEEVECDHIPGRMYKDSKCLVITGTLTYHEVSQVNVPADGSAKHIMKQMVKDSIGNEDSSLWGYFNDDGSEYEVLNLPTRFSILDAQGNPIRSLDKDRYEPTKVISVPSPKTGNTKDNQSEEGEDSSSKSMLSDEVFYKARVLKHFSDLDMLDLSDKEKEEVVALSNAKLTEVQSAILDKVFMTHPSIPFSVSDVCESKVTKALFNENRIRCRDNDGWIKALDEQTKKQFHNYLEDNLMADDAFKKALADAQKQVETLTASEAGKQKVIDTLKTEKENLEKVNKQLADSLLSKTVDSVIELRKELGYHDAKVTDAEGLKALKEKYAKKSAEVINDLYADLLAQKQAGGFASAAGAQALENPLEDKEDDKGTAAPAAPAVATIKDNQDF